jgi:hypothetical protein
LHALTQNVQFCISVADAIAITVLVRCIFTVYALYYTVIAGMSDVLAPVPATAAYKLHWVADASPESAVTSQIVIAGQTAASLLAAAAAL